MSTVRAIFRKELIQTFRDRRMVAILFIAPLVQTTIFGFAVNLDVVDQPTVLVDEDRSPDSRALVDALSHDAGLRITAVLADSDEARRQLIRGEAAIVVAVPRGFGERSARGEAEVQIVVDGSDSNTALRATQLASQILAERAAREQDSQLSGRLVAGGLSSDGVAPRVALSVRALFNPALTTAIFLVPGVLAMVLTVITMMLTAMGLARERELGTLEQLMVTPLEPAALVLGKTLPFALLGLIDVALVLSLANLVFDLPVTGSLLLLFAVSAAFLLTTLGLGLLIATYSATQQQAMLNAFFVILPALMLSGFVFPVEHMPELARAIAGINPLTYYISLARGILVRGAGIAHIWREAAILSGIGLAVFVLASVGFRKRLG